MFSSRLPAALAPNAISRAVAALRAARVPLLDLTETNPTAVGLAYPPDVLDAAGATRRPLRYAPDPLGLAAAREAVAAATTRAPAHAVDADQRRAHGQHERGLRAAVQAAVRSRR